MSVEVALHSFIYDLKPNLHINLIHMKKILLTLARNHMPLGEERWFPGHKSKASFALTKWWQKANLCIHYIHWQWVAWLTSPGKRPSVCVALQRKEESTQRNHLCAQPGVRGDDATRSFTFLYARMWEVEEKTSTDMDQTTTSIVLALHSLDS